MIVVGALANDAVEFELGSGDVRVGVERGRPSQVNCRVAVSDETGGNRLLRDTVCGPGGGGWRGLDVQLGQLVLGCGHGGHAAVGTEGLELTVDGLPADAARLQAGADLLDGEPDPAVAVGGDVRGVEALDRQVVD